MYRPFMTYATAIEVWVPTLVGGGDISRSFQCITFQRFVGLYFGKSLNYHLVLFNASGLVVFALETSSLSSGKRARLLPVKIYKILY